MAKLTGIEIYKLLPKTNCGDCNFPTCMAFAMQVAAKKAALDQCPHVSEEAQTALGEAQAPPMRTVKIGSGEREFTVGGETVLFRHEEKFHHPTGVAIKVSADLCPEELDKRVDRINRLDFIVVVNAGHIRPSGDCLDSVLCQSCLKGVGDPELVKILDYP